MVIICDGIRLSNYNHGRTSMTSVLSVSDAADRHCTCINKIMA